MYAGELYGRQNGQFFNPSFFREAVKPLTQLPSMFAKIPCLLSMEDDAGVMAFGSLNAPERHATLLSRRINCLLMIITPTVVNSTP